MLQVTRGTVRKNSWRRVGWDVEEEEEEDIRGFVHKFGKGIVRERGCIKLLDQAHTKVL